MTVLTSKQIAEYVAGTLSLGADHAYIARRFANEVLELRAENERLREAIKPFVGAKWGHDEDGWLLVKGVSHDELNRLRDVVEGK